MLAPGFTMIMLSDFYIRSLAVFIQFFLYIVEFQGNLYVLFDLFIDNSSSPNPLIDLTKDLYWLFRWLVVITAYGKDTFKEKGINCPERYLL